MKPKKDKKEIRKLRLALRKMYSSITKDFHKITCKFDDYLSILENVYDNEGIEY